MNKTTINLEKAERNGRMGLKIRTISKLFRKERFIVRNCDIMEP